MLCILCILPWIGKNHFIASLLFGQITRTSSQCLRDNFLLYKRTEKRWDFGTSEEVGPHRRTTIKTRYTRPTRRIEGILSKLPTVQNQERSVVPNQETEWHREYRKQVTDMHTREIETNNTHLVPFPCKCRALWNKGYIAQM